jgi:RND family efflux transporter MFP subunit
LRSGSTQEEIDQARAQIEDARARVELTEERVQRNRALVEQGAISRDRFDEVVTENRRANADLERTQERLAQLQENRREQIEQAQAQVAEAREALQLQQSGARPEEIARAEAQVAEAREALQLQQSGARPEEIARAEAQVEERRQELRELQNGTRPEEIAQAEAQLAEAIAQVRALEVELQDTNVLAPFAGIIGDIPVKLGDYVKAGDKITTLTQNDELELRMEIPLERGSELKLGLPVEISDAEGEALTQGRITFVSPTVNQDSQTILAKATFRNNGELRDRQFVRAKVIWSQRPNAIVVPTTAVIFQGQQRFIFVAQGSDPMVAKRKSLELGLIKGDRAEVVQGLVPGDRIVVSGIQKLGDGAPIMAIGNEKPNMEKPEPSPAPETNQDAGEE